METKTAENACEHSLSSLRNSFRYSLQPCNMWKLDEFQYAGKRISMSLSGK